MGLSLHVGSYQMRQMSDERGAGGIGRANYRDQYGFPMSSLHPRPSYIPGSACRILSGGLPGDYRQSSAAEWAMMFGSGTDIDGGITDDAG